MLIEIFKTVSLEKKRLKTSTQSLKMGDDCKICFPWTADNLPYYLIKMKKETQDCHPGDRSSHPA